MIKPRRAIMATTIGVLFFACAAGATTLPSYLHNREGLKHFAKKDYFPAYQEILKALETDPLNPALQMNLGLTFYTNEEYDKAAKAFAGAADLAPAGSQLKFQALFDKAVALAKGQKIDEALKSYQACLDIDPNSIAVKTNIELLWQGGQGQGKSDNKDKKQNQKQGQGQQQQKRDQSQNPQPEQKQQPKPFQSKDLSKEDVKRILDEIKNQEQAIRAEEYEHGAKEAPHGKDW